jgi:uncharacterized protein DUF3723
MINHFAYELNVSHGEIFRQILLHRRDEEKKNLWLSRLSASMQNDVLQLLRHRLFKSMFDPIVTIPGLFHAIELGQLHRLLTMRADEVSDERLVLNHPRNLFILKRKSPMLSTKSV